MGLFIQYDSINKIKILIMAYKISVIILSLSFLLIVRKYWKAKEEKDTCYLNLDKHVKYIKEFQAEAQENKLVFERNIKNQESEIEETKKDKINTESKLRFCENQNKNQLSDLRNKETEVNEKEDYEKLREDYERLQKTKDELSVQVQNHLKEKDNLLEKLQELEKISINGAEVKDQVINSQNKVIENQQESLKDNLDKKEHLQISSNEKSAFNNSLVNQKKSESEFLDDKVNKNFLDAPVEEKHDEKEDGFHDANDSVIIG